MPDLDAAVSSLWAHVSSSNGLHSFLILGHTMAEVARELDAIKTNEVLAVVAAEQPNPRALR